MKESRAIHITSDLLSINEWSRPGRKLATVLAVIFHWVGNPGTSAKFNRDYFESRKSGNEGYGSAHLIIDLDGSVIECIPEDEVAYHVGTDQVDPASGRIYTDWARSTFREYAEHPNTNSPNNCSLGVEMCHTDRDGHFTNATLETAAELAVKYCTTYHLDPMKQIGTHHLVVGWKDCPRLWTNEPALLTEFRRKVRRRMEGLVQ